MSASDASEGATAEPFEETFQERNRRTGQREEGLSAGAERPVTWSEIDLGESPVSLPVRQAGTGIGVASAYTVVQAAEIFDEEVVPGLGAEDPEWNSAPSSMRSRSRSVWRRLRNRLWQSMDFDSQPCSSGRDAAAVTSDVAAENTSFRRHGLYHSRWQTMRTPKSLEDNVDREDYQAKLAHEWEQDIIPNWEKRQKSKRLRGLILEGIPSNTRGQVWPLLVGNDMQIAPGLFDVLCDQAKKSRREMYNEDAKIGRADGDLGGAGGEAETLLARYKGSENHGLCPSAQKAIVLDLPRTFPELGFFHAEDSPFQSELRRLLEAYAHFRPEFGYSQGMSYLAAALLLYLDASTAFCCFANILSKSRCLSSFYKMQSPEVQAYLMLQQRLIALEIPAVAAHFDTIGIESDMYVISWIMSLYCRVLPIDTALRIWDAFFFFGDAFLFKAAIAILRVLQNGLLRSNFEDCAYTLSHLPDRVSAGSIFVEIRQVRFSRKRFHELFEECLSVVSRSTSKMAAPQRTPSRSDHTGGLEPQTERSISSETPSSALNRAISR
ncbi:hypothetical protein CCYA_CCYA07G2044 [Cyanidiococcus yangmingshanensis]|uniref:Rab-GAP TBC domain-containing protein n=1 Tax=Cyanidiococcus yangmingshanensis TaxID=2690220 RepID=A0A7J7IK78_9RHOD|nr:hypothetical protein F1559_001819 [Cyanidiococcus yangmingshanensis]KAK4531187.1 hypothetical protein CCYA_CCYA07G2044 [Cyanidiococcus yangmingshanensis]